MITITKPTYKCEHCRKKIYQREGACKSHELACSKNPKNIRACHSCAACLKIEVDLSFDGEGPYGYVEGTRKVGVLYCKAKDVFLIPPLAEHRGNAYEQADLANGDRENEYMPMECNKHDDGYNLDDNKVKEIQNKINNGKE